jgi:hypothetical protein
MGIPLEEAMAGLDTDYTSEPCTCVSDDDDSDDGGEDLDDGPSADIARRRKKAGLGARAKMRPPGHCAGVEKP